MVGELIESIMEMSCARSTEGERNSSDYAKISSCICTDSITKTYECT